MTKENKPRILFIDNFDSFTYNLVDEFRKKDCEVEIYRNDITMDKLKIVIQEFRPELIVLSPGPSAPKDAGICVDLVKEYHDRIPLFGVCLGHQCMIEAFDGNVERCSETLHGKHSFIKHDGKGIFEGIENPFRAGRYHSLHGTKIPECFEITAKADYKTMSEEEIVMGIRHKNRKMFGVQFHPESVLTPVGGLIIDNILNIITKNKEA